jgi:hypothetical protein
VLLIIAKSCVHASNLPQAEAFGEKIEHFTPSPYEPHLGSRKHPVFETAGGTKIARHVPPLVLAIQQK